MKWYELEKYWQTQPAGSAAPVWNAATFETRRRRLARRLALRDWVEAGTGFFVAALFALPPVYLGAAAWPAWIAVALVLLVTGFFVRERHRARRATPSPTTSMLTRIDAEISELAHQHRLLRNVGWWYVLPLEAAMAFLVWAVHTALPGRVTPDMIERLVWLGIGALVIAAVTIWLNWQAASRTVAPRLEELRQARRELAGD